jgi:shikimate kinase
MDYERIWLIGFMGTGKSRIARPLAAALDWQALDIDTMVEELAHDSVRGIFASGGEGAFRAVEAQAVAKAASVRHAVIATGGGSVLGEENRARMRDNGFVVLLEATPETIVRRLLQSDTHISERPLLAGDDPVRRIVELKRQRETAYAMLADMTVETDELTPDQITHQILMAFRERTAPAASAT